MWKKTQPKISRDRAGRTELHYAAASIEDSSSYVAYLLAAGFDPNDRDHAGVTPLHAAVEHHHIDTVRTLLDAGADVNARDSQGDTPLYYAFRSPWSTASVVQLLRDRGADPHLPNNRGNTPLAFVGMLSNKPELRAVFADLLDDEPA
ncbi:ankyrin repeat domain-containing protein [Nocardia puris]|uniref:Ankyrin repeat protein n=1 Tax=Nocardia puris TaxID=208602 RepID=A0A366DSL0_9NOCA|nr:ankyrin repeat domain-containing protein [Nocardia puris]RBO92479.1 ankyrin repeat protein [Nocardia puris]